jgi:hypothetical protein
MTEYRSAEKFLEALLANDLEQTAKPLHPSALASTRFARCAEFKCAIVP